MVRLSRECHELAAIDAREDVGAVELELAAAVGALWNIPERKVDEITALYAELRALRSRPDEAEDETEEDSEE